MSMEQAILEHAGALRELAAAIKSISGDSAKVYGAYIAQGFAVPDGDAKTEAENKQAALEAKAAVKAKAAELAEARTERVAATKEAAAQDAKANEQDDPQMTRAIPREELQAALKAAKEKAELDKAVEQVEQAALDYKKDVYPVLLQVSKIKGKEALRGLLDQFGAKTGDSLKADQFAAIVADGYALLAG